MRKDNINIRRVGYIFIRQAITIEDLPKWMEVRLSKAVAVMHFKKACLSCEIEQNKCAPTSYKQTFSNRCENGHHLCLLHPHCPEITLQREVNGSGSEHNEQKKCACARLEVTHWPFWLHWILLKLSAFHCTFGLNAHIDRRCIYTICKDSKQTTTTTTTMAWREKNCATMHNAYKQAHTHGHGHTDGAYRTLLRLRKIDHKQHLSTRIGGICLRSRVQCAR